MAFRQAEKMKGAFSLPEVMLSIFVLMVGVLPVFNAMNGGMRDSLGSKDAIVGAELAQEGTELVQNVRDNSFAQGGTGFETFSVSNTCRLDYLDSTNTGAHNVFTKPTGANGTTIDCSPSGAYPYDLTLNNGFYTYNGSEGRFKRKVFLVNATSGAVIKWLAYSVVYWGSTVPANVAGLATCTASNRCAYARTELLGWK